MSVPHLFARSVAAAFLVAVTPGILAAEETTAEDAEVFAVVLENFAGWKEANFGEPVGVLESMPSTRSYDKETVEDVRASLTEEAPPIADELIAAFLSRNRTSARVDSITAASPSIRLRRDNASVGFWYALPKGIKAIGSLTKPGYSATKLTALVRIHHMWSQHAAIVTYVLEKRDGLWVVSGRDQIVYL